VKQLVARDDSHKRTVQWNHMVNVGAEARKREKMEEKYALATAAENEEKKKNKKETVSKELGHDYVRL
jgi:hypothetical protein